MLLASPAGLFAITQAIYDSPAGTAEFGNFRLFSQEASAQVASAMSIAPEPDGGGWLVRQLRGAVDDAIWQHSRTEDLTLNTWEPAEVLWESRRRVYGGWDEVDVVFPIRESNEVSPPPQRFFRTREAP